MAVTGTCIYRNSHEPNTIPGLCLRLDRV
jgi:hypothetical protein